MSEKKRKKSFEKSFKKKSTPEYEDSNKLLYGFHAVRAAWLNPKRRIHKLYATREAADKMVTAFENAKDADMNRPEPEIVDKRKLDQMVHEGAIHQGLVLDAAPLPNVTLEDVMIASDNQTDVLILDQVTDPRNIGAILRTAAVFGIGGVIVQDRNAPDITGVMARAASGGVEYVPIIRVTNLAQAIEKLKRNEFWVVGMDEDGENNLSEAAYGKIALVLGAEGQGLRRLTKDKCDMVVKLPTKGQMKSLNVGNAAAIGMYELSRREAGDNL